MIAYLKKHPVLSLLLIAYVSILIAFTYVNSNSGSYIPNPLQIQQDTPTYTHAIEFMRESISSDAPVAFEDPYTATRLLTTPLMLFASMIVGTVTGNDAFGMLCINILLYFLSVPVFYTIASHIFQDKKTAFIAAILFITNWGLFSFGTTYLADMGGWFFFLLTTMFALQYYRNPTLRQSLYLAILSSIIGGFFKEYGILGLISLSLLILVNTTRLKEKVRDIAIAGVVFSTVLLAYHVWFYVHFNHSYFSWYGYNYESYGATESPNHMYDFESLIRVLVLIFLPGWPLLMIGVMRFWKEYRAQGLNMTHKILLALLPASLTFLAWPAFTHRVAFIFIPWLALCTAFGITKIKNFWVICILLMLYAIVNYNVDVITAIL
jgi:4-amino-4-deoxy-L-arabinose transferase-like glycosyltransferase